MGWSELAELHLLRDKVTERKQKKEESRLTRAISLDMLHGGKRN